MIRKLAFMLAPRGDLPGTVGHLVWPLEVYGHEPDLWWAELGIDDLWGDEEADYFERLVEGLEEYPSDRYSPTLRVG
jgi:hypothetical protein